MLAPDILEAPTAPVSFPGFVSESGFIARQETPITYNFILDDKTDAHASSGARCDWTFPHFKNDQHHNAEKSLASAFANTICHHGLLFCIGNTGPTIKTKFMPQELVLCLTCSEAVNIFPFGRFLFWTRGTGQERERRASV